MNALTDTRSMDDRSSWVFLTGPAWQDNGDPPPPDAVVGGWAVDPDGVTGSFRANPAYVPSVEALPTDPVDACLRLVNQGAADGDQLLTAICTTELAIAIDDEGTAVVVPAPDGEPAVMVATAPSHHHQVSNVSWLATTAADLAVALPDEGVDVLINPGAADSVRVVAGALKAAVVEIGAAPTRPPDGVPAATVDGDALLESLGEHDIDRRIADMVVPWAQDAVSDALVTGGEAAARELSSILPRALEVLERNGVVKACLRNAQDEVTAGLSLWHALEAVAGAWADGGCEAAAALARGFVAVMGEPNYSQRNGGA